MRELDGSSVLIVGYGREGRATFEYVSRLRPEMTIGIADSSETVDAPPGIRVHVGRDYLASVDEYDVVVRSPGVRPDADALVRAAGERRVTSATNLFFSDAPGRVVGITGTKGKSTTSTLIARMLEAKGLDVRLAGNIGTPALTALEGADDETIFVLELSSQQLVDARYSPNVAVVLPIFPEHLDFHDSVEQYEAAKARIVAFQGIDAVAVGAKDSESSTRIACASPAKRKLFFSRTDHAKTDARTCGGYVVTGGEHDPTPVIPIDEIPLCGPGNLTNVVAAVCVGANFGVSPSVMRRVLAGFSPLPHRLEFVGEVHGIRFVNDSLATVPEAVVNALEGLDGEVQTLIVGGHDRGLDYSDLARHVLASSVETLILLPESGARIWDTVVLCAAGDSLPAKLEVDSIEGAVQSALRVTSRGKTCLMSPGAASYGMFRDFSERGDLFRLAVRAAGN